jgi:hypothetical protein
MHLFHLEAAREREALQLEAARVLAVALLLLDWRLLRLLGRAPRATVGGGAGDRPGGKRAAKAVGRGAQMHMAAQML